MRHSVWIVLTNGAILEGWISTSLVKMALQGKRLQERDTFRMVIDEKYGIKEGTLLDVADILMELR